MHQDFPMSLDHMEKYMNKWLVFSVLWGLGGAMDFDHRVKLGQKLSSIVNIPLPSVSAGSTLIDYEVNVDKGEWRLWLRSVPSIEIETHQVLSTDVVIPTVRRQKNLGSCPCGWLWLVGWGWLVGWLVGWVGWVGWLVG